MRRYLTLPATLALFAALACSDVPDPVDVAPADLPLTVAAAPTSEGWAPFAFPVETCEETVDLSGRFHPLSRIVTNDSGNWVLVSNLNAKGTGIGQSSGASYQWNDALPYTVKLGDAAGSATTTHDAGHTHLIGQDGAVNWIVDFQFTIVFSADGPVRVFIDEYKVRCD